MKKYSSWVFFAVGVFFFAALAFSFLNVSGIAGCSSSGAAADADDDDGGGGGGGGGGGAVSACSGGTATGDDGVNTETVGGRSVTFYAPSTRGSTPPLIIAFHGTDGTSAEMVADGDPAGFQALADENCFIVAAPQALTHTERDWDHDYDGDKVIWDTTNLTSATNDDLQLVEDIIDYANTTFGANTDRVYSYGFSNGGFFSLLVAIALDDQIAAFAEAGSGLVTCPYTHDGGCDPLTTTSTDCAVILADPACSAACTGDELPITIPASGPPGILGHNNQDDTVSSYYTCYLADRLDDLGYDYDVTISNAEGHGLPEGFINEVWAFFSTR